MLTVCGEVRESGLTGVTRNHVSPRGSGGSNPPLSATQFVGLAEIWEDAAIPRVDGAIRSPGGTGESEQSHKAPIHPDSSLFGKDSVPRAESPYIRVRGLILHQIDVLGVGRENVKGERPFQSASSCCCASHSIGTPACVLRRSAERQTPWRPAQMDSTIAGARRASGSIWRT